MPDNTTFPLWLLPILGSALMLGFYDVCKKHAVRDNSVMPTLFFSTLVGSAFFMTLTVVSGNLGVATDCGVRELGLIGVKALLVALSWGCVYYGFRELPVSIAASLRSTAPLWTILGGVVLFSEIPTLPQAGGMAAIVAGGVLLSVLGRREGFAWNSKGILLILGGTVLGGVSALYDKFLLAVVAIPPRTLQFHFALDLVVVLGLALAVRYGVFGGRRRFEWRWSIAATGILLIVADALYFYALSLPESRISILSLIRRSSVVVAFAVGGGIFHERNLRLKAVALAIILVGVFALAWFK